MNIVTLLVLLTAGFAASFLVLDVSRITARRRWPAAEGRLVERFRPFPVFLALFAGPALFAGAIWRMRMAGAVSIVEGGVATVIAAGWACCYGLVLTQGVWLLLAGSPLVVAQ